MSKVFFKCRMSGCRMSVNKVVLSLSSSSLRIWFKVCGNNADTVQVGWERWGVPTPCTGKLPDAITPPWTVLGYPRLVRLRVRGPDARCICGRVVTAGASRSPLGRRSPPRFLGPLLPAGPLLRFYCVVTGTTRGSCSDPITVVEPVTPLWTALWTVDPPLPRRFGARIPAIALRDGR